jgi:hypothetical protein
MFKQSIVILLACIGSLLLTSHAASPYDSMAKKYHIPPHVLKGILKVEGSGLTTQWNKGYPSHHAYGPGQMTCIAVKDLGYIKDCNINNSYLTKDLGWVVEHLSGVKGVEMTCKYINKIMKRHKIKDWGTLVRSYNQGYGFRNNRNAYSYQKKTGVK